MRRTASGFTIVELLIVIVVIAILAGMLMVTYTGIQGRAQDSHRMDDLRAIAKSLELYKIDNGNYPAASTSGLGGQEGWEVSAREAKGEFIAPLKNFGFSGGVPVDPVNNAVEDGLGAAYGNGSFGYYYYRYPAGSNGCDSSKGSYYVLAAISTAATGPSPHEDSPGFSCSGRDWQNWFSWVTGGYQN